jgi:ribonuclease HII
MKPTFELEKTYQGAVIGVDEVGRGCLAGPVVTAAVQFSTYEQLPEWVFELNDSKKLSQKKREAFFELLVNATFLTFSIQEIDVDYIDEHNILQATLHGMRLCINSLRKDPEITVLVDGNQKPESSSVCITKGDSKSLSIAAASIIAKVHRDKLMTNFAKQYYQYGWESNKGYGTQKHLDAIRSFGITPYHRKTFAPISKYCL